MTTQIKSIRLRELTTNQLARCRELSGASIDYVLKEALHYYEMKLLRIEKERARQLEESRRAKALSDFVGANDEG